MKTLILGNITEANKLAKEMAKSYKKPIYCDMYDIHNSRYEVAKIGVEPDLIVINGIYSVHSLTKLKKFVSEDIVFESKYQEPKIINPDIIVVSENITDIGVNRRFNIIHV